MSKKILKRRLVMGALMAFIITGNAWAAEDKYNQFYFIEDMKLVAGHYIPDFDYSKYDRKLKNVVIVKDPQDINGAAIICANFKINRGNTYKHSDITYGNVLDINNNIICNNHLELFGCSVNYDTGNAEAIKNRVDIIGEEKEINITTRDAGGEIFIVGGMTNDNYAEAIARENEVNIDNVCFFYEEGEMSSPNVSIMGGQARTGYTSYNEVEIKYTTITDGEIYGGVSENRNNIRVDGNLPAYYSKNNTVTIGDGVVLGVGVTCAGGKTFRNTSGNADSNIVNIIGNSNIAGTVFGGFSESGTASNNIINIKDNADVSQASLYGDNGGAGTGNTLNLETGWNGVVGSAKNFNVINVGEGVEVTFNESIVADEPNTVINIGYDGGDDNGEDGVKESLLIGQIITKESGSSSLNFINGSAWKATGASKVSALQGDVITIKVDKAEKDFVTVANNLTESQVVTLNVAKNEDVGVDVRTGVQGMLNTAVDDNGTIVDILNVDEITLKASVDTTVNNGQVENVVTTIKPGDKFVVESDVVATGDLKAGNVSLKETASQVDLIKNKNLVQDNRLDGIEAKNVVQDGRLDGIDAKNEVQDGRLDGIDAKNAVQDGRLDGIDAKNVVQDNRLDGIDAKNVIQDNAISGLNQRLGKMNGKINKVGAGAAALAALHPLDFDPDDKLSFSAGVGNYAGENAAALGMFYRPNEKVMLSMGGTVGSDEEMVNLGISFALDKPNNVSNSRVAMAKELITLREYIANQDVRLAKQDEQIAQLVMLVKQLTGKNIEFKAEPIEELSKDGSIRIERLTDGYEEYDRVRIK